MIKQFQRRQILTLTMLMMSLQKDGLNIKTKISLFMRQRKLQSNGVKIKIKLYMELIHF